MARKRNASNALLDVTKIIERPSTFNSNVTLFEPGDFQIAPYTIDSPRRSKRIRGYVPPKTEKTIGNELLEPKKEDIEDALPCSDPQGTILKTSRRRIKVEVNASEGLLLSSKDLVVSPPSPVKKVKDEETLSGSTSPKKQKLLRMNLDVPHPAPARWKEAYSAIQEMRSLYVAPVDTMGCDKAQVPETNPKSRRLSTLISLMLSSQTKDEVTDAAVAKLRVALGGSITLEALLSAPETTVSEAISKVGFWRRKTGYIKQAALRLKDDFDGDVPKTVNELCSLPGVGPKMAFLCLQRAWDINDGIGVDVHVHRITNRLRWHKPATKNPEETRLNLQSWLPKELHPDINHLLVGFGQTICLPVSPRCDLCTLSSSGLCPSSQKSANTKNRKALQLRSESTLIKLEPYVKMELNAEAKIESSEETSVKVKVESNI